MVVGEFLNAGEEDRVRRGLELRFDSGGERLQLWPNFEFRRRRDGRHGWRLAGSGFFVDPNGLLFTSYSVGGETRDIVVVQGDLKYSARRLVSDERSGMAILDLAGANQGTVSFITNYGHRLYSDDFLHQLDQCFGQGDFYENQSNPRSVDAFLHAALDFPEQAFDGVLVWDVLEYLAAPLLAVVVQHGAVGGDGPGAASTVS